jgi:uncharacterized membrane protein
VSDLTHESKYRVESIDMLRGIVMIIMALDHVRDFFHIDAYTDDPLNLTTTTPILFFTRWITHLCAPTFVFLSGVSIYLQTLRKTKKELSAFVIKRGLWLIVFECTVMTFIANFDPLFHIIPLAVIWAIGISMVILGILIRLPYQVIFVIGMTIVLGHNALDVAESAPDFRGGLFLDLFHSGAFKTYTFAPGHSVFIIYPFLPWTGLMILGYCAGVFFTSSYTPDARKKIALGIGISLIASFVILRSINGYGDPFPWRSQDTVLKTFFAFMKVHKYPPSLMYMAVTIGISFILLSALERVRNGFTTVTTVFGRTALFYYAFHFLVMHVVLMILFFIQGEHTVQEAIDAKTPFLFVMPGEGFSLGLVYAIWVTLVASLYPVCSWYDRYKTSHKEKWWLSYL